MAWKHAIVTDGEGAFQCWVDALEPTRLEVRPPMAREYVVVFFDPRDPTGSIRLPAPFTLRGRVVDATNGGAIEGFTLSVGRERPNRRNSRFSGERSDYELAIYDADRPRWVQINKLGFASQSLRLAPQAGGSRDHDFRLMPIEVFRGEVVSASGRPAAYSRVWIGSDSKPKPITLICDGRGSFELNRDPDWTWLAIENEAGCAVLSTEDLPTSGELQLDPWSSVEGWLTESASKSDVDERETAELEWIAADGSTLPRIERRSIAAAPRALPAFAHPLEAVIGPDGFFGFDRVPPGRVRVRVGTETTEAQVVPGETATLLFEGTRHRSSTSH